MVSSACRGRSLAMVCFQALRGFGEQRVDGGLHIGGLDLVERNAKLNFEQRIHIVKFQSIRTRSPEAKEPCDHGDQSGEQGQICPHDEGVVVEAVESQCGRGQVQRADQRA